MNSNEKPQSVYIFRHGETEWSKNGKHTGVTDIPLTPYGIEQVIALSADFKEMKFSKVFCSPSFRARKTCEILGFLDDAQIDNDLQEWNYGDYEGVETHEIRETIPNWSVFTHGCLNGESTSDIEVRADRVIKKIRSVDGDVAIFSSGHFSRALAVRWINLPIESGKSFILNTGTFSILSYERENPAIKIWNHEKKIKY